MLLPDTALDTAGAEAEAELLRSGRSGLKLVEQRGAWSIYELPDPTPLLTGPGTAEITTQGHDRLRGIVGEAGMYLLRVRWMPYWSASGVIDCVTAGPGGQTLLRARSPGGFELSAMRQADVLVERIFAPPTTGPDCDAPSGAERR